MRANNGSPFFLSPSLPRLRTPFPKTSGPRPIEFPALANRSGSLTRQRLSLFSILFLPLHKIHTGAGANVQAMRPFFASSHALSGVFDLYTLCIQDRNNIHEYLSNHPNRTFLTPSVLFLTLQVLNN